MSNTYCKAKYNNFRIVDPDNGVVVTQVINLYYVSEDGWDLYDTVKLVENEPMAKRIVDLWRTDNAIVEALLEQHYTK